MYKNGVTLPDLSHGTYLLLVTTMPRFLVKTRIFSIFNF